jgi:hypothetical protein
MVGAMQSATISAVKKEIITDCLARALQKRATQRVAPTRNYYEKTCI